MSLTTETKIKLLEGALALLGKNGEHWTKDTYRTGSGLGYCLAGAVGAAALKEGLIEEDEGVWTETTSGESWSSFGDASDYFSEEVSIENLAREKGWNNVPEFNDESETDFEDVAAFVKERLKQLKT